MIYKINLDLLENKIKNIILNRKYEDVTEEEAEECFNNDLFFDFEEIAKDIQETYYNHNSCYEFTTYLNKEQQQIFIINFLNHFIFDTIDFDEVGKEEEEEEEEEIEE